MASFDIFQNNAFKLVEMTQAIEDVPYMPTLLGDLNIFTPVPIRTEDFGIERRDGKLSIIQSSRRGAPVEERVNEPRNMRAFKTIRLAKGDTIRASEIQFIRAFGQESEFMAVQAEVARRLSGPMGILSDMDITWENQRLGGVQGIVYDADGSVIINWYDEWGIAQPAEVGFPLNDQNADIMLQCQAIRRAVRVAAKGSWIDGVSEVHALVGDTFYDKLTRHASVKETFKNWNAAVALRQAIEFEAFYFGGIWWHNYRGTDDFVAAGQKGTKGVGINADKAKFFPTNTRGAFQVGLSPAEFFGGFNGQPGRDRYSMTLPDPSGRQAFVRIEVYSYPLFVCTRPEMLQRAGIA